MIYRLVLTGICATVLALAQGRGGGGGGMGGEGGGGGGMGGGGGEGNIQMPRVTTRMDRFSELLKLDKEQKKAVKAILDEGQKEATPVREQMVKARLAIGEAIASGKSEDDLKPLISAEGALDAQLAGIELMAFSKIYKILDKEQLPQTRPVFPTMKGIFDGKNWNSVQ